MLDNLRNQASFEEEEEAQPEVPDKKQPKVKGPRKTLDQATGMTAKQRFFLALMLLMMVCLMGLMLLFVTEKIVLPF